MFNKRISIILLLICISTPAFAYRIGNAYKEAKERMLEIADKLKDYKDIKGIFPEDNTSPPYGLDKIEFVTSYKPYYFNSLDPFATKQTLKNAGYGRKLLFIYIIKNILYIVFFSLLVYFVRKVKSQFVYQILVLSLWVLLFLEFFAFVDLSKQLYTYFFNPINFHFEFVGTYVEPIDENSFFYTLNHEGDAYLASKGPDFDFEYTHEISEMTSDDLQRQIITYSPTNGLYSNGDLWVIIPNENSNPIIWKGL